MKNFLVVIVMILSFVVLFANEGLSLEQKTVDNSVIIYSGAEEYRNAYFRKRLTEQFPDYSISIEYMPTGNLAAKLAAEGINTDIDIIYDLDCGYAGMVEEFLADLSSYDQSIYVEDCKVKSNKYLIEYRNGGAVVLNLDILKAKGVKATFFVTNKGPDELIKREFDEGHTVALHTASHNYALIYSSDEAYFNDLRSVGDRVKRITGQESKIIRFPGGASNTISRRYSQGIMTRLTSKVLAQGYKYYDWNVSSGDAGSTTDPNQVYLNVVNGLHRDRVNMVLMHDIKPYTRDALARIIDYCKNNGYPMERITMSTEMITQRVNN